MAPRSGRRSSSTSTIAALEASVASSRVSRLAIVDLLEQLAQFRDVLAAELAVAAEVRDQRRDAPVEQALEQALAFAQQPRLALQHRAVAIAAAIALGADRPLPEQAVEQRLDRGFLPVAG